MHAMHVSCRHDAGMKCMHDACLHHAQCMMCMDSLEGLLYFVKLVCTMNKTLEETMKKDLINQLLTVNFILFV